MADQVPAVAGKKPWLSKTLWANFVIAAIALFAPEAVQQYMADHQEILPMLFAVVNIALRLITKDAISLAD